MPVRPIDIAKKLNISTSALRHYESWGIVPPPERAPNGYRIYTEEHVAYFECIRAMLPGFGMNVTKDVMVMVREKETDRALWTINEQQARLHQDKTMAEKTLSLLETESLDNVMPRGKRKEMTIGEVAAETGVPASAIRHWEREGLLSLPRGGDNGYRLFNGTLLRQILIIRTLRAAAYPIESIRQVMKELDLHHIGSARRVAKDSLAYLNHINRSQTRGIHYLYRLLQATGLM